ncbi:MAG TPA: DoxX family protein [Cyclobacteriaceae bacterium]|jgi:putative oxidoreductase
MKQLLFSTGSDWTGLVLRLCLGLIMLPHGGQKLFGWFGGFGFEASVEYLVGTIGLPWIFAVAVVLGEFLGPVGLILGLASRFWAAALALIMAGAIFTVNLQYGFFMNWFGNQQGEGYEFHLLMIGISLAVILNGSGRYSMDGLFNAAARSPSTFSATPIS